ncbi:hypothetical protein ACFY2Y_16625 [Janibacter hoylei]|uniref:hypothetical protein n=1 Tax=Janibacter hoylei TaxID=364298 RepID=UPI00367C987B
MVLWSHYEDLMAPGIDGARVATRARRKVVAEAFGTSTTVVDDARRELLAEGDGGAWLHRSSPQGCKRATRHLALRRPQDTGAPFVRVPRWTRERVWLGRDRTAGQYSAAAWRLYALALRRTGPDGGTFDARMSALGAMIRASGSTARRRLAELEAAGLAEVTERPGCWPQIRIVVHPDEAAEVAKQYREHGRRRAEPPREPCQIPAITPAKSRHPVLPDHGTPQKANPPETDLEEAKELPPVGDHAQDVARAGHKAAAGTQDHHSSGNAATTPVRRRAKRGASAAAVRLLRHEMPRALLARVPEHGIRRVLHALDEELAHRSVAELASRIGIRWEAWRYRPEDIQDPTAVAITLVRRGYHCPDVRCEHAINLDTATPCGWCEQEQQAPSRTPEPPNALETAEEPSPGTRIHPRPSRALSDTLTPPPVTDKDPVPEETYARAAVRGGSLARRLLEASPAERVKIIGDDLARSSKNPDFTS